MGRVILIVFLCFACKPKSSSQKTNLKGNSLNDCNQSVALTSGTELAPDVRFSAISKDVIPSSVRLLKAKEKVWEFQFEEFGTVFQMKVEAKNSTKFFYSQALGEKFSEVDFVRDGHVSFLDSEKKNPQIGILALEKSTKKLYIKSSLSPAISIEAPVLTMVQEIPRAPSVGLGLADSSDYKNFPKGVKFVARSGWEAANSSFGPTRDHVLERVPWKAFVFHHTVDKQKASNLTDLVCATRVKAHQSSHMAKGWSDIGYHFLICPTGTIYEGREGGLNTVGAHAGAKLNSGTVGIAFIGNYDESESPQTEIRDEMIESAAVLMAWLTTQTGISMEQKFTLKTEVDSGESFCQLKDCAEHKIPAWHNDVLSRRNNAKFGTPKDGTNCAGSIMIKEWLSNGKLYQRALQKLTDKINPGNVFASANCGETNSGKGKLSNEEELEWLKSRDDFFPKEK